MTTSRAFSNAVVFSLPLLVAGSAVVVDAGFAGKVGIMGLAVWLNLLVLERVVARFVAFAATGEDAAAAGRLVVKFLATVPIAAVVLLVVGPAPALVALTGVGLGAGVHALATALRAAETHRIVRLAVGGSA